MEEFRYKRLPAALKAIAGINPEKDVRVRILGEIVDRQDGMIIVDDGTTTAQIITDAGAIDAKGAVSPCETGDLVCVFARVLPLEDGYELRGEIVQNKNGMDMNLHKKIYG